VLCCAVLCCAVLCCAVLCCAVLCCTGAEVGLYWLCLLLLLLLLPLLLCCCDDKAKLCLDINAAVTRLVVLKTHYPRADLPRIIQKQPQLLLQNITELEDNAKQVGGDTRCGELLLHSKRRKAQFQVALCNTTGPAPSVPASQNMYP
jgi:hypothetical protein